MKHWVNTYPHDIYASVLLIDNKIMAWKVGQNHWTPVEDEHFSIQNKRWTVENPEGHEYVFKKSARDYFKQWELHKSFKGDNPYKSSLENL